jgi:hypothetical protein
VKTIGAFSALVFISVGIFGQGIVSVQKVGETPLKKPDEMIFYSLPRTVLAIKVKVKRTSTFCGPYFAYAEEFLGIKSVPAENKIEWNLDSINIFPFKEADPDEIYALKIEKGFNTKPFFELTESGFIFDPSVNNLLGIENAGVAPRPANIMQGFKEMSVQKYYMESNDTLFKTIFKDSIYVKMPVSKPKTQLKTLKDKAREAADVIVKLRQRRYDLILSDDETLPEVKFFKSDLEELQKMEDDYLALFTGRRVIETFTTWFFYTPIINTRESQFEIFRFSNKAGLSDHNSSTATSVFLTFEKDNRIKLLNDWLINTEHVGKNHLLYRIPDAALINILWKGDVLASKKVLVCQFGTVVPYPVIEKK